MVEPPLGSAIFSRRDCPYFVRTTELGERLTCDRERSLWLASFVFIVNCQLFVGLIALARVPQHTFPEFVRACEVPVTLCEPRECRAGDTIGFLRQSGGDRLFVQSPRTLCLATSLANTRHPVQL